MPSFGLNMLCNGKQLQDIFKDGGILKTFMELKKIFPDTRHIFVQYFQRRDMVWRSALLLQWTPQWCMIPCRDP